VIEVFFYTKHISHHRLRADSHCIRWTCRGYDRSMHQATIIYP